MVCVHYLRLEGILGAINVKLSAEEVTIVLRSQSGPTLFRATETRWYGKQE